MFRASTTTNVGRLRPSAQRPRTGRRTSYTWIVIPEVQETNLHLPMITEGDPSDPTGRRRIGRNTFELEEVLVAIEWYLAEAGIMESVDFQWIAAGTYPTTQPYPDEVTGKLMIPPKRTVQIPGIRWLGFEIPNTMTIEQAQRLCGWIFQNMGFDAEVVELPFPQTREDESPLLSSHYMNMSLVVIPQFRGNPPHRYR